MIEEVNVELLRRLRAQILIHSYLYYWMDSSVWSDAQWQHKADELQTLQEDYLLQGLDIVIGFYDDAFKDWTSTTGAHLPRDEYVVSKALQIYRLHSEKEVDFNKFAGS